MRVLWICGLPTVVQEKALQGQDHGSRAAWSWIVGHFPPPPNVELHLGCLWPGGDRRKSFEFEGATFHLVPCPRKGRALFFFQKDPRYFKPLFTELDPGVVHGWGTEDSHSFVAQRLAPRRHVVGIQGLIRACYKYLPRSYRTPYVYVTEYLTLKRARNVVAESNYSLDRAVRLCPRASKCVIELPLRREFLEAGPSDGTARAALFVGTIQESKGILDAIVAFSRAAPQDWTLHVAGAGTPANEARMISLVRNTGIAARFRHSRTLDSPSLVKAMQESSVFLLPSRSDTGPTALKEALTMGLWPVCYDNSGPGEYVRKYGFGSLARDRDMNSLYQELKRCLTNMPWKDAEKRQTVARQTREDFSRERAWRQLSDFYSTIALQFDQRQGFRPEP